MGLLHSSEVFLLLVSNLELEGPKIIVDLLDIFVESIVDFGGFGPHLWSCAFDLGPVVFHVGL